MESLHKHKMAAYDSMLKSDVSTLFSCRQNLDCSAHMYLYFVPHSVFYVVQILEGDNVHVTNTMSIRQLSEIQVFYWFEMAM